MSEASISFPPLNFAETEIKATELRTAANNSSPEQSKALKLEANKLCCDLCEEYINNTNVDLTDMDITENMPIDNLVFLYINLKYSKLENKDNIRDGIDSALYAKIDEAVCNDSIQDIPSIETFLRYRLNELKKENDDNDYNNELKQQYTKYLKQIKEKKQKYPTPQITVSQITKDFIAPNIKEINALGRDFFALAKKEAKGSAEEKSLRRQGNQAVAQGCFEYLQSINEQDWEKLSTEELVFLHKNTRFDRKNKAISNKLLALTQQRLKPLIQITENGNLPEEQELKALIEFCKYRSKDIEKSPEQDEIFEANEIASNLPKLEQAQRRIRKQIDSENKKQISTPPSQEETHIENFSKEENKTTLTSAFEQVCEEKKIRYTKSDNKETETKEYDLYSQNAPENAKPSGKLSIRSETNVDLQSEEMAHFVALAQAIKDSGAQSITIGELNPNKEKALKFVAQLSLAGAQVGIKVICPEKFSKEDLIAAYPDYAQAEDLIRQRIERNKKRHYRNKDKQKEAPSSEASRQTMPISRGRDSR